MRKYVCTYLCFYEGMLIGIENVKVIYNKYVMTNKLQEFPVQRICQCPLEGLFSRCRSHSLLGSNTNPTVLQFKSLIRKILVNNELTNSIKANCSNQLDILYLSSRLKKNVPNSNNSPGDKPSTSQNITFQELPQQHQQEEQEPPSDSYANTEERNPENVNENIMENEVFDQLQTNCDIGIAFVAGQIEKNILDGPINCDLCGQILIENEKISNDGFPNAKHSMVPCSSTYNMCKTAHQILESEKLSIDFKYENILNSILTKIQVDSVFSRTDFSLHPTHKIDFVTYIIETYVRMWALFVAKQATISNQMKHVKKQEEKHKKIEHFRGK